MRNALAGVLATLLLANAAKGQRLYHKELDAAAQQALKAMEKVDSKQLFDRMLQNLSTQSRQDVDTTFSGIRRQTRDHIQTWGDWCAVHADMVSSMKRFDYPGLLPANPRGASTESALRKACADLLQRDPTVEVPKDAEAKWRERVKAVRDAKADRQKEIDDLKNNPGTAEPQLLAILGQLGNLTEAEQAIKQFQNSAAGGKVPSLTAPAAETVAILARLGEAYQDFKVRQSQIEAVQKELRELKAEMLKIAVLKLAAEEEHLKRLIGIEERRAREIEDAVASFEEYRAVVLCERQRDSAFDLKRIDESLRELGLLAAADKATPADEYIYSRRLFRTLGDEEETLKLCKEGPGPARLRLGAAARALFQAAAVQTRGATPEYLAELRRAQEEQRYSIVQSSLEARAYETLVETGIRRLALLHSGGIKPQEIAQLVYQAGQLTGISVIAVKQ